MSETLVKNWRTTALGVLTLAAVIAPIWAPPDVAHKIQASAAAIAGCGLLAAKDGAR